MLVMMTSSSPRRLLISNEQEEDRMTGHQGTGDIVPITERVARRVRERTHGRIRNLDVRESQGQVVVSGQVPTRHAKQLALQGALELLTSERFCEKITVV